MTSRRVEPGAPHEVAPLGPVRFQVEFHRMASMAGAVPRYGNEQLLSTRSIIWAAARVNQRAIVLADGNRVQAGRLDLPGPITWNTCFPSEMRQSAMIRR